MAHLSVLGIREHVRVVTMSFSLGYQDLILQQSIVKRMLCNALYRPSPIPSLTLVGQLNAM